MLGLYSRRLPRHPLARAIGLVITVLVVMALLAVGAFALVAFVLVGAAFLLVNALRSPAASVAGAARAAAPPPPPGVIEGEFTVVREPKRERSA